MNTIGAPISDPIGTSISAPIGPQFGPSYPNY